MKRLFVRHWRFLLIVYRDITGTRIGLCIRIVQPDGLFFFAKRIRNLIGLNIRHHASGFVWSL